MSVPILKQGRDTPLRWPTLRIRSWNRSAIRSPMTWRAPLRHIDGFSRMLLDGWSQALDDQGQDYLRRIRTSAARMAELIDDLLQLARVTRAELQRRPIDPLDAGASGGDGTG